FDPTWTVPEGEPHFDPLPIAFAIPKTPHIETLFGLRDEGATATSKVSTRYTVNRGFPVLSSVVPAQLLVPLSQQSQPSLSRCRRPGKECRSDAAICHSTLTNSPVTDTLGRPMKAVSSGAWRRRQLSSILGEMDSAAL